MPRSTPSTPSGPPVSPYGATDKADGTSLPRGVGCADDARADGDVGADSSLLGVVPPWSGVGVGLPAVDPEPGGVAAGVEVGVGRGVDTGLGVGVGLGVGAGRIVTGRGTPTTAPPEQLTLECT